MISKKDRLRPTQPFFVLDADEFCQEIYLQQGISHFYTFYLKEDREIVAVPDGCIDLCFQYYEERMEAFACGSVVGCAPSVWKGKQSVFGVRFMPGYHPAGVNVALKDLLGKKIGLENLIENSSLIERLEREREFSQRILAFLQEYAKLESKEEKTYEKKKLTMKVKDLVYESDGLIKIHQLEEETGYTERYIRRVFSEQMGFSPKTFCKIIQFQRALEFLNYGVPDKMTKAAVDSGYYDQSQFIRDFKAYAGMTPRKYVLLIQNRRYQDKIQETHFLNRNRDEGVYSVKAE